MDEIEKLYNKLYSEGLFSKSFDEFKEKYKDPAYQKRVYDAVSNEGFYSGDYSSFNTKFSSDLIEEPEKDEQTEQGVTYQSDIDMQSFFSEDGETLKQKDFSYFDQDFDKMNEDIGGFFGNLEETITKDLDKKFKKWGFTFQEAEVGSDAIKVISTINPDINKTFNLDNPNKAMSEIRSFIDTNKRDNAVYSEGIKDISIDDDYVQDLLKATAENDEEKKDALLTGISRKIYASSGVNYDEIKNLESKNKKNVDEMNFLTKNILVYNKNYFKEVKEDFNPFDDDTPEVFKLRDYTPTEEEIKKYPRLFNEDGSLKFAGKDGLENHLESLRLESEKIAEVTASDFVFEIKNKEKILFDKFKNKETAGILETSNILSNQSTKLASNFKSLTGVDISNYEQVNRSIESKIKEFNNRVENITGGISLENLKDFKPTTQQQVDELNQVLEEYNIYYAQTLGPINQIYNSFSVLGKEQENINNIGNAIGSMLEFDDLYKYKGQYTDNKFKSVINQALLGWSQGEVNEEFLKVAYGITDPNDEEEIAGIAKKVAEEISYQKGILTSSTWEKYQNASSVAEQFKILGTDPGEVILSLFANSMSMNLSTGKSLIIPVIGGSGAIGAGIGASSTPYIGGAGALPGLVSGLSYGLATWQAIAGFNMELGSAYSEELTKAGYDLTDENSIIEGLRNENVVKAANQRGIDRGVPIGIANFVGGRVGASLVSPLATTGKQFVRQLGKGLIVEPGFEGFGELAAQVNSDGEIVGTEILNEMIGGMPGSQTNIAVQYAKNNFLNIQAKLADKLTDVSYMSDKNYGYNDIRAFTNRLLKNKKITREQAKKIVENARIVDETNSIMRKSPKFIGGRNRTNARNRISDLIETRNAIQEQGNTSANDLLGNIETEINEIASTGKTLESSSIITLQDYSRLINRTAVAGASLIKKKLNADIDVINFNEETAKTLAKNNPEIYNSIIDNINDETPGFITPEVDGKQYIVINENVVAKGYNNALLEGDLTGGNVIAHEILHAVLDASFDEAEVKELAENLETYILDESKNVISKGARNRIKNKLNRYEEDYGGKTNEYYQEVFTTLSDEMQEDNINFNRQDRTFWQSMADIINDFVYKNKNTFDEVTRKGLKIKTAEQAFNFVKDYNKIYKKGNRISKGKIRPKAPIVEDKVRKSIITKGEQLDDFINRNMTKDQFQRERTVEVAGKMMTPFDAAYTALQGPVFDRLIGAKVKDTKGKSKEDFIQDVKDSLSNLLITFNPQENDSLFAWVNAQVGNRIGTVSKATTPKTKSIDEKVGDTGRTRAETLAQEETDIESRAIEEAKEVFTLEDKIDLDPETVSAIENEVAKINFTKLPDPSEQITKNKTVTPFVSELKQSIGKTASGALSQASRAIVVQMGKRGKYVPYLRKNLPFIIKKLPIGYLAKNMPSVVMKSVDGKYTSDWQGKTIDKYTTAETGMTSQPQKMKLKPNITKEDINNIISKFAKPNGSPIQSKQEGLAYQIASELGLEKFGNSFEEKGNIYESFEKAQKILDRPDPQSIVGKLTSDIERGIKGVRYTVLANPAAQVAVSISIPQIAKNISNISMSEVDAKKYIKETIKGVINSILPEYGLNLETKDITSIVDKIITYRRRAISALEIQSKGKQKRIDVEKSIIESTLQFQENVVSHLGLNESVKSIFQDARNINDSRRSYLDQYKKEIENGRDPLDVIIDVLRWDAGHLSSASQIADKGFTLTDEVNDLGQQTVVRIKDHPSNKTNRAQVFANNKDFIENLVNLISDKYDVKWRQAGKKILLDGVYIAGTDTKVNIDTTTPAQNSDAVLKAIDSKVEEGLSLEEAKRRVFKERETAAKQAQERIIARMEYLKNKDNAVLTAMTMASLKSSMNAILRAAANAKYLANVDLKNSGKITYEHLIPAEIVAMSLLQAYFPKGSLKINVKELFDAYSVALIPESMDNVLKKFGFQQMMTPEFLQDLSKFLERYYNDLTYGSEIYAITDMSNNEVIGEEWQTAYEIDNDPATTRVTRKSLLASNIMPDNENNKYMVDASVNMSKALNNSIVQNAPVKKIRVFDFDDTLATSKNIVVATRENETIRLNAEQFAERGKQLVDEGYVMDFSDFNRVTDGGRGPLFTVAQKIKEARGNEDLFVLTARAPESRDAIYQFLKSQGLEFKRDNIIGLGNSTGEAKAQWLVSKAAEGYNDFYFADDAIANVKAVKNALAPLDIKSKIQQAKVRYSILSNEFNDIIEKNTGIAAFKEYSSAKAKTIGASKGNFKFWIPYSAEDFLGLIYPILGKGAVGDKQMAWFKTNLIRPYTKAMESLAKDRINLMADFKALKKRLKIPKIIGKKNKSGFTNEQAVRVYIWNKLGYSIPGLSKTDLSEIVSEVEANKDLKNFADQIQVILKDDKYIKPSNGWLSGTITSDLIQNLNTGKRAKYLQQWQANVDAIFSEANLNKLEAIYGSRYVEALRNTLARMKAGTNRLESGSRLSNRILDYINGSVGAIMFFNARSAVLQTISSINFINWSFNNPLKAGKAFANQKQYWSDFMMLMNSDYLVDRRNGQKIDINEAEIRNAAATSKNKTRAAIAYLLQKGFLPTQIADSFAIASGGATFYRNRVNDLVSQGLSKSEAEQQALLEFREIAEESQQSSDPSRISQQQASSLGRVILAFANTPMQYARLTKRAYQDLVNGRGDAKSNISKIIYYTFVQNMIFNALQQAVFALGFGDDEEDDEKKEAKYVDVANGMLDSQLRGLGIGGAAISVIKNFLIDIYERSERPRPEYVDAVWKLMQFSPPISSKISKLRQAAWQFDSKKRREEIYEKGFSLDNPAYEALSKVISATTNVPLDRLYSKGENIQAALSDESDWWQKVAMLAGWPEWQIMDNKDKVKTKRSKNKKLKLKKKKILF